MDNTSAYTLRRIEVAFIDSTDFLLKLFTMHFYLLALYQMYYKLQGMYSKRFFQMKHPPFLLKAGHIYYLLIRKYI